MNMKRSNQQLRKRIKNLWDAIGDFEKHECDAWSEVSDIQWEARASERMKAYDRLFEMELDKNE